MHYIRHQDVSPSMSHYFDENDKAPIGSQAQSLPNSANIGFVLNS